MTRRLHLGRRDFIALLAAMTSGGCAMGGLDGTPPTAALPATEQPTRPETPADAPARPSVKVAMLLPLSGATQHAAIAKSLKQAGELALFDRDDGSFQLIALDDKGTPEGARQAAAQAVKDGAELILGPLFGANVGAAASAARAANIPVIAFSNDRQAAGPGIFLIGHAVEPEVERVVAYAANQGKRRFAALIPDEPYGHLAETALRAAVQRSGGAIVGLQRYPRAANGMLEPARQLGLALRELEAGGQPADALFLPGDPELLAQLAPLVTYAGIDTSKLKIIGTGAMDQPGLGRVKMYAGAWFASPDPKGWQDFNAKYASTFGTAPPRIATLAYDAVGIAIVLSKAPAGSRFTAETITRPSGFSGVDGVIQLTAGGAAMRNLAVLEVQDFGAVVVDPASAPGPIQMSGAGLRMN